MSEPSGTRPFAPFEWMLSLRYLRARRKEGFISVIAGFSFLGIMLGILFHMLNSLFSHVGLLKEWPPVAAAAVPSLLFLATALAMMVWIERLRPVWVRFRG